MRLPDQTPGSGEALPEDWNSPQRSRRMPVSFSIIIDLVLLDAFKFEGMIGRIP
jgi:hypothetical protein